MCLEIINRTILTGFRGSIAESTSSNKFLYKIKQYFAENEKAEMSNLLSKLVTMNSYFSAPQFGHFVVSYNTQKEKWILNELISHRVQEEERVLREKTESAHLESSSHDKKQKKGKDIGSGKSKHQLYGYLYLIHEKSQAMYVFKEYKVEVELQLNNSIKAVRSDRGGKPNMNGVVERRTRILKDMVRTEKSFFGTDNARFFKDVDFGRDDIEHEDGIDIGEDDPVNLQQVMRSPNSQKWIDAMNEELQYMKDNDAWDLIELPKGQKLIGCKWVFKTKRDSSGNIKRYKARIVAKGFAQIKGIDYNETFSPISTRDSFRIFMALVAHYDLEIHPMDVKTAFLNRNIDEIIYMVQPENFVIGYLKTLVCKLRKSIYDLKQASREWYHKFHHVITSYDFEVNLVEHCVYHKFSGSKFIFLLLYVDDILLVTDNIGLLHYTKKFLTSQFEMKDLGNAYFVSRIHIHRDRSRGILGL
ncbi:hypothetical protein AgCh_024159 [Apium graveolens]